MKTVSTSLDTEFLEDIEVKSGIGIDSTYVALSILINDNLLDDSSRKELLSLFPALKGYESRKAGYKDFKMEDFKVALMKLIEQTSEGITKQQFGSMHEGKNEVLVNNEILMNPLVENLRMDYEKKIKELKSTIEKLKREEPHTENLKQTLETELLATPIKDDDELKALTEYNNLKLENERLKVNLSSRENITCSQSSYKNSTGMKILDKEENEKQIVREQKRNEKIVKENTGLQSHLNNLGEKMNERSGPHSIDLEEGNLKEILKDNALLQSEIKNMTKKYAAEIEIKDNIIAELQSLLKNSEKETKERSGPHSIDLEEENL